MEIKYLVTSTHPFIKSGTEIVLNKDGNYNIAFFIEDSVSLIKLSKTTIIFWLNRKYIVNSVEAIDINNIKPSITVIETNICCYLGITPRMLHSGSREKLPRFGRQLLLYYIKYFHSEISLKKLGEIVRTVPMDHSTVSHNLKVIRREATTNSDTRLHLTQLNTIFNIKSPIY